MKVIKKISSSRLSKINIFIRNSNFVIKQILILLFPKKFKIILKENKKIN